MNIFQPQEEFDALLMRSRSIEEQTRFQNEAEFFKQAAQDIGFTLWIGHVSHIEPEHTEPTNDYVRIIEKIYVYRWLEAQPHKLN